MSDDSNEPVDDEEEDRRAILARRSMLIASTLAGIALASSACTGSPSSHVAPPVEHPVMPIPTPPEPRVVVGFDGGSMLPEAGLPMPQPCLSIAPREEPVDAAVAVPDAAVRRDASVRRDVPVAPLPEQHRLPPEPPGGSPMPCLSVARDIQMQMPLMRKPTNKP
jgi:hypothetical protein